MPRRMSCSMTVPAVRARTKTVTRRHPDTWKNLKPGDRLTLVEKGMGLKVGERQVVLAEVEIVGVWLEPLGLVSEDECAAEGFPDLTPDEFIAMWAASHGFRALDVGTGPSAILGGIKCRRIEWRYL